MSPLACCLVALAALFAVSDANMINPFCSSVSLGESMVHEVTFNMNVSGGDVFIPNKCPEDHDLKGQDLNVCNIPNSMPEVHTFTIGKHPFEKVYIDCPNNTRGCSSLELQVTQYCEVPPIG
ncbi:uncharacterized protein LOC134741111 [Cydia strobilella]|uniref:uncharacterized protein LOC134741111 n=1 Tax=Cydia strobilella TaxID=1100964 RepID=UPI003005A902